MRVLLVLSFFLFSSVHAYAASGGPDASGYRWVDSNEPGGPTFNYEAVNGSRVSFADDSVSGPYSIGFPFRYYGQTYSQFWVSSNGFMTFVRPSGTGHGCCNGYNLGGRQGFATMIAGYWTDLLGSAGIYRTRGEAGRRVLVFQQQGREYGAVPEVQYQIKLYESSGQVEIHVRTAGVQRHNAAVGIQNQDRDVGLTYRSGRFSLNNTAIRFMSNSPPVWTIPAPLTVYAGQILRANVGVGDADDDQLEVMVRGMPSGAIWNRQAGKFRWQPTLADAGEHSVRFGAQEIRDDGQEPLSSEAEFVINVIGLNQAPEFITAPPAASIAQGDVFRYEMFAADPEAAGEVVYGLIEGPPAMTLEGNVLSWTADLRPSETADVRVFAADIEGNRGYQSFSIGVDTHPQAPVAVIVAQDSELGPGRVQLSGVPSYAMGDRVLTYDWQLVSYPEGILPPPVASATAPVTSALLRSKGVYRFELQVHDGELFSNIVGIDLTVINVAPVAVVGEPIEFEISDGNEIAITLDGSESYDANSEDSVNCVWAQSEGPTVTLEEPDSLVTQFVAMEAGDYAFTLTCSDSELTGEAVSLVVTGTLTEPTNTGVTTRPPATPDDGCSSMAVSTWLLFALAALRRRRKTA